MTHLQKHLFVKQNTVPSMENIQIPKTCSVLAGEMYLIFSYKCPAVKPICFTDNTAKIISAVASIHMPVNLFLDTVNPRYFWFLCFGQRDFKRD